MEENFKSSPHIAASTVWQKIGSEKLKTNKTIDNMALSRALILGEYKLLECIKDNLHSI